MPLLYRLAARADLPALVALEEGTFHEDRLSARSFRQLIVAEEGNGLLGYALLLFRRGTEVARLYSLATSQQARGRGLGSGLLEQAEHSAARHGCRALRLEVRVDNSVAIGLYERRGYRRFGQIAGFYEDGADAWRYEKPLI